MYKELMITLKVKQMADKIIKVYVDGQLVLTKEFEGFYMGEEYEQALHDLSAFCKTLLYTKD